MPLPGQRHKSFILQQIIREKTVPKNPCFLVYLYSRLLL